MNKNSRGVRSLKGVMAVIAALTIAGTVLIFVQCADPVKPDGVSPYITEQGYSAAEQLLYVLRSVRTLHDLRTVDQSFEFTPALAEVPFLSMPAWGAGSIVSAFSRSLSKKAAAGTGALASLDAAFGLGKTTAAAPFVPGSDSVVFDTVYTDSTSVTTYVLSGEVLLPGWETGIDSLFRKGVSTALDTLRAVRIRYDSIGDTLVADRQDWKKSTAGWSMTKRLQTRTLGTELVYSHSYWPRSNDVSNDTVFIMVGGVSSTYRLERFDQTLSRWNSLAGSKVIRCTDSVVYPAAVVRDSLFDTDTTGDVFDFSDTLNTQTIGIFSEHKNSDASVVLNTVRYSVAPRGIAELVQYTEQIFNGPGDTVTVTAGNIDHTAKTCSLYVDVASGSVTGAVDSTTFGIRKKSMYQYVAAFSAAFDTLTVKSLYRHDLLRDSGRIKSVEWTSAERAGGVYDPDTSALTIKANYAITDSIQYQQWTMRPSMVPASYDYTCITRRYDTLNVSFSGDSVSRRYRFNKPSLLAHTGTLVTASDGSRTITDTLGVRFDGSNDRIFNAEVSTAGTAAVSVIGRDTATIALMGDTAATVGIPGASSLVEYPLAWKRVGDRFSCIYVTDAVQDTFAYDFTVEQNGTIHGSFSVTDRSGVKVVYSSNVFVNSRLGGSADVAGAVYSGDNTVVSAKLNISLWQDSRYQGDAKKTILK